MEGSMWGYDLAAGCFTVMSLTDKSHVVVEFGSQFFHLCVIVYSCFVLFASGSTLPDNEVQTLRQISSKLDIRQWNVNPSSCRTGQGLNINYNNGSLSNVTCDCTFNSSTICHVTIIELSLDLHGELPFEFANLTYLSTLNLNRNYLNGTIPRAWASLPLVNLSLLGNLVTGTIPKEIGNIRTLEFLNLQDNKMEGPIPEDLGNLVNLRRALLGGNDYTGRLPDTFGNLKNLTD
ncbi:Mdis1-interacting receptor like kinase, partial [Thalictrum thalictroides]